jgi:hypothetical protein
MLPARRRLYMFEYHVMGANGMTGMQKEITKRAADGWELVTAYQETGGGFLGFFGRRHVLVFRKAATVPSV